MTESRIIVTCAPVALAPNLPAESTYSTYEQVACPQCAGPMWLGAKGKVQVEHGAEMLCMVCVSHLKIATDLAAKVLDREPVEFQTVMLTDPKAGNA